MPTPPEVALATGQQAALASLLAHTVEGVVAAQRVLDNDALARVTGFVQTPRGELVLPPLWFTFREAKITLEMAATVTRVQARGPANAAGVADGKDGNVRLDCRLVNPAAVSLFGYAASSGIKLELTLAPQDAGGLRPALADPRSPA
jgi:hypothetical protein